MRSGIELANGVGFVAEELDTERAVGFRRVHVEDAAANRVLARHLDYVGGGVPDGVEMREEGIEIEGFATTDGAGEAGVVVAGAQADGCRCHGRDDDGCRTGSDLPQSRGALFLEFRVRREILEGKHVASGEGDNGLRIAGGSEFTEAAEDRQEIFHRAVVVDDEDERASGSALKKHEQQGFRRGREAGDTHAPRALLEVGGNTREGGELFYVHEEFADERQKHAGLF